MQMHTPPLTPTELARRAKTDVKTVTAFLKGDRWPRSDNLAKLDRELGFEIGSLEAWGKGTEPISSDVRTLDNASDVELASTLLARLEAHAAGTPAH